MRLPWRFATFLVLCLVAVPLAAILPAHFATMAGFDVAAMAFLASLAPLFGHGHVEMRAAARAGDANRTVILLVTGIVLLVLLVLVASELGQRTAPSGAAVALILATLALAWLFANMVFAVHYAFLFYGDGGDGHDAGGLDFPGTEQPDYGDFTYFAVTLGMTFQTSDVAISGADMRRVVTFHSLAAFVFNLGIVAFTINVLGGGR